MITASKARPALLALAATTLVSTHPAHAADPIIQTKFTADPAPFVHDGVLYLYTTHDEDDAPPGMGNFLMRDWLLYKTTDMVNWTDCGTMASLKSLSWTGWAGYENGAWAHQVIERNGKFYMYVTAHGGGIGVLVADSPTGPFKEPLGKPLIGPQYDTIDPTVMIDKGQAYLYWGNPNLWYVKLNEDMVSISGEITKDPSMAKKEGQPDPFHYQEGPWVWKRGDHYYNAYASTCCPEGIGYAMAGSPTGPWEFKGYIIPPDGRSSGNHPGIIDYNGKSYVFGFSYKLNFIQTKQHHERRSVCVTEMEYNPDGTIQELPWWEEATPAAQIKPLDPYTRVEGETIAWCEGIKSEVIEGGGMNVFPTRDGAYIKVRGVDFGTEGAATFTASIALATKPGLTKGASIELRLDTPDGPSIGTLPASYTNDKWESETIAVNGATGVRDLVLVFKGDSASELLKLDHWSFAKKAASPELSALNVSADRYKIDTAAGASNRVPLKVSAIYSDGTSKDVTSQAKISVQKPEFAVVSDGAITGKTSGETNIEVAFEGKSDSLSVIVKDLASEFVPQALIVSEPSLKLLVGNTRNFTIMAHYPDGHTENVTDKASYEVLDPKIASAKGGVITALEKGTTQLRLSYKGEFGKPASALLDLAVAIDDPFFQNNADNFAEQKGIITEKCSEGGMNLGAIENGDWVKYDNLDFGAGAESLELRVSSATVGGTIEVRLDGPEGPVVGTCEVAGTGGWQKWVTKTCKLTDVKGRRDLVLKFKGGGGFLLNVQWWNFINGGR